jgi:hypothetical protein
MMKVSLLAVAVFAIVTMGVSGAWGQIPNHCPYDKSHWNELACLIPDVTRTGTSNIQAFNTTLARVIGQLPVAVPVSGLSLTLDRSTGVYMLSSDLGGVLTERGSTLGKGKLFLGFTYQHFDFDSIDGTKITNLPTVSVIGGNQFLASNNRLSAVIDQYTAIAAVGLSDRMDLSVTLPIDNVSLRGTASNIQVATNGGAPPTPPFPTVSISGSASGAGDLFLNGKYGVVKGESARLAVGLEVRLPTGNEFNLLGSGAYGFKPYIVYSRLGKRFHPHANFGYQWNSQSVLNLGANGTSLRLPDSLVYSAGADYSVLKRLTLVGDFVGQHYFDTTTITRAQLATGANVLGLGPACVGNPPPSNCNALNGAVSTVGVKDHSAFDEDNLAVGIKLNPFGKLVLSANVLIKLNDAGLRANYVPLVGISYKF